MVDLRAIFSGLVALPVLVIVVLVLAVIVIALLKKQRVRAGIWSRSSGFFLEADNGASEVSSSKELIAKMSPTAAPVKMKK
jgi:hypothetical protein